MFNVYIIRSKEGYIYTGQTKNIEKRIFEHNNGMSKWTKRGSNWILIYSEEFLSRAEAMIRERYFKTGVGREFVKKLIAKEA